MYNITSDVVVPGLLLHVKLRLNGMFANYLLHFCCLTPGSKDNSEINISQATEETRSANFAINTDLKTGETTISIYAF